MKRQHCSNCMFSSWYHNFKEITFNSRIIKLNEEFIQYLNSDGIILPDNDDIKYSNDLDGYSDTDDDGDGEDEKWTEDKDSVCETPRFPQIKEKVDQAIKELGGKVFPKLNWSSPKDASWISFDGTLKCTNFNDICLLLKSSEFVTHDLMKPYEYCEDLAGPHPVELYELVLREWIDITPGMEFRCFVKCNKLIGISQRNHSSYYDYLVTEKQDLLNNIIHFFNAKIKGVFADQDVVFDMYINNQGKFCLVDFNPFGKLTDALLFSWKELNELDASTVSSSDESFFRIITSSDGIQPSPYLTYALPKDVVDLSCGEDINKMIDFFNVKNLIARPGDESS